MSANDDDLVDSLYADAAVAYTRIVCGMRGHIKQIDSRKLVLDLVGRHPPPGIVDAVCRRLDELQQRTIDENQRQELDEFFHDEWQQRSRWP